MMKPLPILSQAYNVILQEEKKRGLNTMSQIMSQSAAFNTQVVAVNTQTGPTINSAVSEHVALAGQRRFNSVSYSYKDFPKDNNPNRRQMFCDHCKMQGHTIQRCYKIQREEGWRLLHRWILQQAFLYRLHPAMP